MSGYELDGEDYPQLDGLDPRIEISSFGGQAAFSTHFYAKVERVEVHRVLSEGDAARLNRGRPMDSAARYLFLDTYHGFDSVEDVRAAAEIALDDWIGSRISYDETWPRILLIREAGLWVPISTERYYTMYDNYHLPKRSGTDVQ